MKSFKSISPKTAALAFAATAAISFATFNSIEHRRLDLLQNKALLESISKKDTITMTYVKPKKHQKFNPATLKAAKAFMLSVGHDTSKVNAMFSDSRLEKYPMFKKRAAEPDTAKPKPKKKMTYGNYKNAYNYPELVRLGREFQSLHADSLAKSQSLTGTPSEMTTAIFGVETYYGKKQGDMACVNVFLSLIEDAPNLRDPNKRQYWDRFGKVELAALAEICGMFDADLFSIRGSKRGAVGPMQFLPSNILAFAKEHGTKSLSEIFSIDVAIAFISRYLARSGASIRSSYAIGSANYNAAHEYNHSDFYSHLLVELAADLKAKRQLKK
ncbi:MAG TPA: lytic murein transglycosylase [Candidatus Micrarchaeota archaeon]|nr:lytic murein transglycosylase [Candidatus Micrarchaeota archaeon]